MKDINFSTAIVLCLIAFILGMIVFLFIFSGLNSKYNFWVPNQPVCVKEQYINNPSRAIREGFSISDILFLETINNSQHLMFKRPIKTPCAPGESQVVEIKDPQFCSFSKTNSGITVVGKQLVTDSNIYKIEGEDSTITTQGNCIPSVESDYSNGEIILNWVV